MESMTDDKKLLTGDDLAAKALADTSQESLPAGDDIPVLPASPAAKQKVGETLTALQNVIERNVSELDRLKEQLTSYKDSLRNIMDNDETLSAAEEKATQVSQKVKERKAELHSTLEANQLKANITEVSARKKEIEEALNNHLLNLYQLTGAKTFDTSAGETREFDIRASIRSGKKAA
jgi:chromosome segregation ATPase